MDYKLPIPVITGNLSYYAIYTRYSSFLFNDFHNGATKYPTLRDVLTDCRYERKVLDIIHEKPEVYARFSHYLAHNATDSRKMFLSDDIVKSITVVSQKSDYDEEGIAFYIVRNNS